MGPFGGIDAIEVGNQKTWALKDNHTGRPWLDCVAESSPRQNRLWRKKPLEPVKVDVDALEHGFVACLDLLHEGDAEEFAAWFQRINNVVVRYVAYATAELNGLLNAIYSQVASPEASLGNLINDRLRDWISSDYNKDYRSENPQPALPKLLVLRPEVSQHDLLNLDVPAFYHRLGTCDLVNSRGQRILVPPVFEVEQGTSLTFSRETFFADSPKQQVEAHLAQLTFYGRRRDTCSQQIRGHVFDRPS